MGTKHGIDYSIENNIYKKMTHFGSPACAARAAASAATDPAHKASLQQLLSPGVQAVQLLHGAWENKRPL